MDLRFFQPKDMTDLRYASRCHARKGIVDGFSSFQTRIALKESLYNVQNIINKQGQSNPIYPPIDFCIPVSLRRTGTSVDSPQEAFPNIGHMPPLVLACVRPPD